MYLLTIVILGIAANLDNMCIGMSYGLMGKNIKLTQNIVISVISGIVAFVACALAGLIGKTNLNTALYIGSGLLIFIGLCSIIGAFKKTDDTQDSVSDLSIKELIVLGLALAINCIPVSFGAGLSETQPLPLGLSMMLFSLISVSVGNCMGKKLKTVYSSKWLNVASGVMIIALGVMQFFV